MAEMSAVLKGQPRHFSHLVPQSDPLPSTAMGSAPPALAASIPTLGWRDWAHNRLVGEEKDNVWFTDQLAGHVGESHKGLQLPDSLLRGGPGTVGRISKTVPRGQSFRCYIWSSALRTKRNGLNWGCAWICRGVVNSLAGQSGT